MVDECFRCGITSDRVKLYDAISKEGIVKICRTCNEEEGFPLINRPTTYQLKEAENYEKKSVYDRLSKVAGLNPEEHRRRISTGRDKEELMEKQNTTLRDIVDQNYKRTLSEEKKVYSDLIDNFHWAIMRARRSRKLTQKQLGVEIAESEAAIKMAEEGVLPSDSDRLINKLESFLGIKLSKKNLDVKEQFKKDGVFDPVVLKSMTVDDLKNLDSPDRGNKYVGKSEELYIDDFDGDAEDISEEEFLDGELASEKKKKWFWQR